MTMTLGSVCLDMQAPLGWRFFMGCSNNPTKLSLVRHSVTSVSWSQVTNDKERSYHPDRTQWPWSWWGGRTDIIYWGRRRKVLPLRKHKEMIFSTALTTFNSKWEEAAVIAWEERVKTPQGCRAGSQHFDQEGFQPAQGGSRMGGAGYHYS